MLDPTDRRLLAALRRHPRAGVAALARHLELARNTVSSRLDALVERGVITGFGPDVDPAAIGYGVTAFSTLMIAQGSFGPAVAHLRGIPEVLEIHTVTGRGDLLVKVMARTNDDLHDVLQRITSRPEIVRADTQLALHTSLERRAVDLVTR